VTPGVLSERSRMHLALRACRMSLDDLIGNGLLLYYQPLPGRLIGSMVLWSQRAGLAVHSTNDVAGPSSSSFRGPPFPLVVPPPPVRCVNGQYDNDDNRDEDEQVCRHLDQS
jgi:hypothetical protein